MSTTTKPKKKSKQKFTFHRIGWKRSDGSIESGWWALIETEEQLNEAFKWQSGNAALAWLDVSGKGHPKTKFGSAAESLLDTKMFRENKPRMSMPQCVNYLERIFTKTLLEIFYRDGSVYMNKNGGCHPVTLAKNIKEKIFEKRTQPDFIFPDDVDEDEIKIARWPNGNHFYIQVNGKSVEIDGVLKYNTVGAAEAAMKKYKRRNKRKNKKRN